MCIGANPLQIIMFSRYYSKIKLSFKRRLLTPKNIKIDKTIDALLVRIERGMANQKEFCFTQPFQIGRTDDCHIRFEEKSVSRIHAEVYINENQWYIRDLNSSNGTFLNDTQVTTSVLPPSSTIKLGTNGPILHFIQEQSQVEEKTSNESPLSVTKFEKHYFSDSNDETAGEHTRYIRMAFQRVKKSQKRKYWAIIFLFAIIASSSLAYAIFKNNQVQKQKILAQNIFYSMKSIEIKLAELQNIVSADLRTQQNMLEKSYNDYIQRLDVYGKQLKPEDRLILKIARIFGECEINMPQGFVEEVKNYIGKWQSTNRYRKAISTAQQNGYINKIVHEMLNNNLAPQFFYLALQESDFDTRRCGPVTRHGIAKGMWQFIPETGYRYGLQIGPLFDIQRYDPGDERHQFNKSTEAAAQYLKFIYSTHAQASGLLVMASYNWGENRVISLIQSMPMNPQDRNFWQLLNLYRNQIPAETYDYVFYIVAAAVIGENPRLFGFNFDNPLKEAMDKVTLSDTAPNL